MSLFDGLLNGVLQSLSDGKPGSSETIGDMLNKALANTQFGSLQGVLDQLQSSGLGAEVTSWLGQGGNLPVSVDQIRAALGNEQLQKLAAQFGIPLDQVASVLAQHLPAAVDKLSPNGTLSTPG
jgi:uncharacterized protein YidB (DUF937 family)